MKAKQLAEEVTATKLYEENFSLMRAKKLTQNEKAALLFEENAESTKIIELAQKNKAARLFKENLSLMEERNSAACQVEDLDNVNLNWRYLFQFDKNLNKYSKLN